jgi:hypothetical protein
MPVGDMLVQNILPYDELSSLSFGRAQCEFANKLVSLRAELRHEENKYREQMGEHASEGGFLLVPGLSLLGFFGRR